MTSTTEPLWVTVHGTHAGLLILETPQGLIGLWPDHLTRLAELCHRTSDPTGLVGTLDHLTGRTVQVDLDLVNTARRAVRAGVTILDDCHYCAHPFPGVGTDDVGRWQCGRHDLDADTEARWSA